MGAVMKVHRRATGRPRWPVRAGRNVVVEVRVPFGERQGGPVEAVGAAQEPAMAGAGPDRACARAKVQPHIPA